MVSHMFFPLVTTITYSAPICFIIKYRFKEKVQSGMKLICFSLNVKIFNPIVFEISEKLTNFPI